MLRFRKFNAPSVYHTSIKFKNVHMFIDILILLGSQNIFRNSFQIPSLFFYLHNSSSFIRIASEKECNTENRSVSEIFQKETLLLILFIIDSAPIFFLWSQWEFPLSFIFLVLHGNVQLCQLPWMVLLSWLKHRWSSFLPQVFDWQPLCDQHSQCWTHQHHLPPVCLGRLVTVDFPRLTRTSSKDVDSFCWSHQMSHEKLSIICRDFHGSKLPD